MSPSKLVPSYILSRIHSAKPEPLAKAVRRRRVWQRVYDDVSHKFVRGFRYADTGLVRREFVRVDRLCIYGKRWDIETFFKVSKSHLRLAKELQGHTYDQLFAHTTIVFARYIMLSAAADVHNGTVIDIRPSMEPTLHRTQAVPCTTSHLLSGECRLNLKDPGYCVGTNTTRSLMSESACHTVSTSESGKGTAFTCSLSAAIASTSAGSSAT